MLQEFDSSFLFLFFFSRFKSSRSLIWKLTAYTCGRFQKYRLHTRRSLNAATSSTNQPVDILGSLWPSGDQSDDAIASKGSTSQSGSPLGPLQFCGSAGDASTTGGDSMEDDEDSKSESISWKLHVQGTGKFHV